MSQGTWQFLGTVATAALALLGIWLSTRTTGQTTRTTDAQQLIDQMQEEAARLRADHTEEMTRIEMRHKEQMDEVKVRLADLASATGRLEDRELILLDYVQALRHHIDQGAGPPPPTWPPTLMHRGP